MIKAPPHKRRRSSTQRLDVVRMNRNRTSYRNGKLTIETDDGRTSEKICDESAYLYAGDTPEFDDLADITVQIPRGTREIVLRIVPTKTTIDAVQTIAGKTQVTLSGIRADKSGLTCRAVGDLSDFLPYLAGHSDTAGKVTATEVEHAKATTGASQHERECIQSGLSPAPLGKDYSQGKNQPNASTPVSGRRNREDIDRPEWKGKKLVSRLRCDWRQDTEIEFG